MTLISCDFSYCCWLTPEFPDKLFSTTKLHYLICPMLPFFPPPSLSTESLLEVNNPSLWNWFCCWGLMFSVLVKWFWSKWGLLFQVYLHQVASVKNLGQGKNCKPHFDMNGFLCYLLSGMLQDWQLWCHTFLKPFLCFYHNSESKMTDWMLSNQAGPIVAHIRLGLSQHTTAMYFLCINKRGH